VEPLTLFPSQTLLFALVSTAAATAVPRDGHSMSIKERQSCVYYCGNTCYWQTDIDSALSAGYKLYQEGKTEGKQALHFFTSSLLLSCIYQEVRQLIMLSSHRL
jgi:hypothetical protein